MKSISLSVNGEKVTAQVTPRTSLADFMRGQLNLTGTHLGCEQGVCGACTVMIDGQPTRSCITLAAACDGLNVRTVEGFEDDPVMGAIRGAFSAHHGLQCGFCTPGMLITARDIVSRFDHPDEAQIRHELSGNLCRCTGYQGIVNAIASVCELNGRQPLEGSVATIDPLPVRTTVSPPTFKRVATEQTSASGGRANAVSVSAPVMHVDEDGWTILTQNFAVPHPRQKVWDAFEDVRSVAMCMPGTEITTLEGPNIEGRLLIKFGPIAAAFAGQAKKVSDAATHSGTLEGKGVDSGSGTSAQGAVSYTLRQTDAVTTGIEISVRFKLSGPLAQFGRSGLVKDFAARLTDQFASNLSKHLAGESLDSSSQTNQLNAFSLVFGVLWRRIRALFGG